MNAGSELEKKPKGLVSTIINRVKEWWEGDDRRLSVSGAYQLAREHHIDPFSAAVMAVDDLSREALKAIQR